MELRIHDSTGEDSSSISDLRKQLAAARIERDQAMEKLEKMRRAFKGVDWD